MGFPSCWNTMSCDIRQLEREEENLNSRFGCSEWNTVASWGWTGLFQKLDPVGPSSSLPHFQAASNFWNKLGHVFPTSVIPKAACLFMDLGINILPNPVLLKSKMRPEEKPNVHLENAPGPEEKPNVPPASAFGSRQGFYVSLCWT